MLAARLFFSELTHHTETMVVTWNDEKHGIGIPDIDNQHKELMYILQQVNDLTRAIPKRQKSFLPDII